jgi:hypothetical protein
LTHYRLLMCAAVRSTWPGEAITGMLSRWGDIVTFETLLGHPDK